MAYHGYELGLASVSFRKHSPREILAAMQKAGLHLVEWGSDVHAPCDDRATLQELSALQKEFGIQCSSYGTYFRLGETPMGELKKYIEAAAILGTNILRLWCGRKSGAKMTPEEKQFLLCQCREAAVIAQRHAVVLCMECHRDTFTENPDDALWLMESVNSPAFRMYWQPFQWQTPEENCAYARKIAPYTQHIHVFYWLADRKLPLSRAIAQWQAYLKCFPTPHTLLLEFMPTGSLGELQAEAEALRQILVKL